MSLLPLVSISVLTVKDNFVRWVVQSEEIFQTIPQWAQFSQGQQRGILSAHVRAILEQLNPAAIVYTWARSGGF